MCEREFERLRREVESRKVALVCKYSVICNGEKDCLKCPYLRELKVVDLTEEKCECDDVRGVCDCG
jgi:hypothetical protein